MEDPAKVTATLNDLNRGIASRPWVVVNGNNVLPEANAIGDGYKFNYDRGYVVKMFVNTRTGELRCFAAKHFEY